MELLQRKFHVTIPFAYSTGGYGFVFNMFGYGHVEVGPAGVGGMRWQADAALDLDIWVTSSPSGDVETPPPGSPPRGSPAAGSDAGAIYSQYAGYPNIKPFLLLY